MPKSISSDGGKTWQVSKTPFSELASGQRPTLIRLQSGRLFFAGDFQQSHGRFPKSINERGSYVALSEDEGETWRIKKLPGTLPSVVEENPYDTIGYAVARQAPNGIIHLLSTKTHPNQHFELNEAWILSDETGPTKSPDRSITKVEEYKEFYPSGRIRSIRHGGIAADGEFLLEGRQTWYYENGGTQWEVTYHEGRKTGEETWLDDSGRKTTSWVHDPGGRNIRTRYWTNGRKRSETEWKDFKLEGLARIWDRSGRLKSEKMFQSGKMQ